jgi:hypothetical protein
VLEATRCLPADDTMALAEVRRSVTQLRLLIRQAAIVRSTPWSLQASLPPAFSNLHLPLAVPSSRNRLVGQARYGTPWKMGRALPHERAKRVARYLLLLRHGVCSSPFLFVLLSGGMRTLLVVRGGSVPATRCTHSRSNPPTASILIRLPTHSTPICPRTKQALDRRRLKQLGRAEAAKAKARSVT